jgi:hypothetical protein
MNLTPEQKARLDIDAALEAAGWILQNCDAINLAAGTGVAVREARMASGHGFAEWIGAETLDAWVKRLHTEGRGLYTAAEDTKPSSLRGRITTLPLVEPESLYANQIEAVTNLEQSLKRGRPRALSCRRDGAGRLLTLLPGWPASAA